MTSPKKGILERLNEGPVIGDGGYVWALEKRGYVKGGPWTPEVTVEHPSAVSELHREFMRCGSDVLQALTFYSTDDKLQSSGAAAGAQYTSKAINKAACDIAKEIAKEGDNLVAGSISQTPSYYDGKGRSVVQQEIQKQVDVFLENSLDFIICEYFEHVEEIVWAIEVAVGSSLPVAATMCIGPEGDLDGVSAAECAVRMAKAGAKMVGTNCHFDPMTSLKTMKLMKEGLHSQKLDNVFLMTQPFACWDGDCSKLGYTVLPEFPFACEPRLCTRWDMHKYARQAYELGVRYIGGCCGFEPYHIRAVAEELTPERRGRMPLASAKHEPWGGSLKGHFKPWVSKRASREYWYNLEPSTGRPFSSAFSHPDTTTN